MQANGQPLAPAGVRILARLDDLASMLPGDIWVTCGTEGHAPEDPHSTGEAIDISVKGWSPALVFKAVGFLNHVLGLRFTVLYEVPEAPTDAQLLRIAYVNPAATGPHIHTQKAKSTIYPPLDTPTGTVNA